MTDQKQITEWSLRCEDKVKKRLNKILTSPNSMGDKGWNMLYSVAESWLEFRYKEFTNRKRVGGGFFYVIEEHEAHRSFCEHLKRRDVSKEFVSLCMDFHGFERVKSFENGDKVYFYIMEKNKFNEITTGKDDTEIIEFVTERI